VYPFDVTPEARLLRYFLAVAEELNFTRAAETLRIAQPALSAQIRQLESQLGVQLLERTTRTVQLTEAGRALCARGPAALAALEQAFEAARQVGRGVSGRLHIAYSTSAGYETAPRLVQALRDQYPDIEVAAEVLPTPAITQAVLDHRVDVGLARTPVHAEGIRLRTVRVERQGVLVRTDHPLARRHEVSLAEVAEFPLILHARAANPGHYDLVIEMFRTIGTEPKIFRQPISFDPGQRAILEGRAIGLVGASSELSLVENLCWVPLADPAPRLDIALVIAQGRPQPLVQNFEEVAIRSATKAGWLPNRMD
jgi:LysR family transcriptional regulator, benzoate and cis,cis-muconate-responsive activator of ben and cat genes